MNPFVIHTESTLRIQIARTHTLPLSLSSFLPLSPVLALALLVRHDTARAHTSSSTEAYQLPADDSKPTVAAAAAASAAVDAGSAASGKSLCTSVFPDFSQSVCSVCECVRSVGLWGPCHLAGLWLG